mmetsp:Transcript_43035/g.68103  ORF Transcript_43035/g.68103 Transcript_43035/m.68103 type:complete len:84 (+) Transcript_43035:986-1237(+)
MHRLAVKCGTHMPQRKRRLCLWSMIPCLADVLPSTALLGLKLPLTKVTTSIDRIRANQSVRSALQRSSRTRLEDEIRTSLENG